jgi:hypothetical protein
MPGTLVSTSRDRQQKVGTKTDALGLVVVNSDVAHKAWVLGRRNRLCQIQSR